MRGRKTFSYVLSDIFLKRKGSPVGCLYVPCFWRLDLLGNRIVERQNFIRDSSRPETFLVCANFWNNNISNAETSFRNGGVEFYLFALGITHIIIVSASRSEDCRGVAGVERNQEERFQFRFST